MRFVLATVGLISIVAAATLRPQTSNDPLGYGNARSHEFSKGDSGYSSGWRECAKIEEPTGDLGIVCEGHRKLRIHGGANVDVNYFCEFRFIQRRPGQFRLDYELCQ